MNPTSITLVKPFGIPKVFSSVLLICGVCTEVEKCSPLNRMFSPERDTRQGAWKPKISEYCAGYYVCSTNDKYQHVFLCPPSTTTTTTKCPWTWNNGCYLSIFREPVDIYKFSNHACQMETQWLLGEAIFHLILHQLRISFFFFLHSWHLTHMQQQQQYNYKIRKIIHTLQNTRHFRP